jgi:hypothetical protein
MYPPPRQQPLYAQQLLPGWEQRTQETEGSFGEAFDLSFDRYATPAIVTVSYALTWIICLVTYIGTVLAAFAIFGPDHEVAGLMTLPGSPWPGIIALVLGWIPALLTVLVMRFACEQALATVRTAIDVRALRTRYVGSA